MGGNAGISTTALPPNELAPYHEQGQGALRRPGEGAIAAFGPMSLSSPADTKPSPTQKYAPAP